ELGKGSRFWFTWNVESIPSTTQPIADCQSNLSYPLTGRTGHILVIDPVTAACDALAKFIGNERIEAFGTVEEGIVSAKIRKEQNDVYEYVILNVLEDNMDDIKRAIRELGIICGKDHLRIVLMIFWSSEGQRMAKEIGDQVIILRKPVTPKRLLNCLRCRETNKSIPDENREKSRHSPQINDLRSHSIDEDINMSIDDEFSSNKNHDGDSLKRANLKRTCPEDEDTQITDGDRKLKSRTRFNSKSKCILCVEDNPINLKVIQHQLMRLGYQSLSATNGQEAVNLVTEAANHSKDKNSSSIDSPLNSHEEISLILMDCTMPIMSGFEASKIIRAMKPPISQIPIIALTASAVQGSREKCLESGMNDYLTKPLKMAQLEEMLHKWLND
ncbi:18508_t:CDS:2, partial [Acaulospora morrowiae]